MTGAKCALAQSVTGMGVTSIALLGSLFILFVMRSRVSLTEKLAALSLFGMVVF